MPYASDYTRNVETILVVHSFGEWPIYAKWMNVKDLCVVRLLDCVKSPAPTPISVFVLSVDCVKGLASTPLLYVDCVKSLAPTPVLSVDCNESGTDPCFVCGL